MPRSDKDSLDRVDDFKARLKATGLSITEFQRASGLSRNVIYNLSKGQKPSSQAQADALDAAFKRLRQ